MMQELMLWLSTKIADKAFSFLTYSSILMLSMVLLYIVEYNNMQHDVLNFIIVL